MDLEFWWVCCVQDVQKSVIVEDDDGAYYAEGFEDDPRDGK